MTRRFLAVVALLCLLGVSCSASAGESPGDGSVTEPGGETDASGSDTASCGPGITSAEAVTKARELAAASAGEDVAFGFFDSGDVVADVNAREDFWEVTFTKESGAIEIYLTCAGDPASIGTNGDATP